MKNSNYSCMLDWIKRQFSKNVIENTTHLLAMSPGLTYLCNYSGLSVIWRRVFFLMRNWKHTIQKSFWKILKQTSQKEALIPLTYTYCISRVSLMIKLVFPQSGYCQILNNHLRFWMLAAGDVDCNSTTGSSPARLGEARKKDSKNAHQKLVRAKKRKEKGNGANENWTIFSRKEWVL